MKNELFKIPLIIFVILSLAVPNGFSIQGRNQILAEDDEPIFEEPELPREPSMFGRTEGTAEYFEIKDSEYLNVTLKSSEEIKVVLESIPRMISLI